MAIAQVTLDDTFDEWRTKTNQLIVQGEQLGLNAVAAFSQANVAYNQANIAFLKANSTTFTSNLIVSVADNNNAAFRITQTGSADAFRVEDQASDSTPFVINSLGNVGVGISLPTSTLHVVGTANITTSLNLAGTDMLTRLTNVGAGANSYSDSRSASTGLSANIYSESLSSSTGIAANTYSNARAAATGVAANSYTDSRITTVNAAIVGANANAANATYLTNGNIPSTRLTGSYTGINGLGTITSGTWQAAPIAVNYGGTGATTQIQARTNLGLGNVATINVMITTTATAPSGGNPGDIWIQYNP